MLLIYIIAGYPWKTQEKVDIIRDSLYNNTTAGLCGNDDCGQMSAWYVFSALGFYPVNPADGNYIIGTPLFEKVIIKNNKGSEDDFVINAKNVSKKNKYIHSAKLNNMTYNKTWISHEDIVSGGELDFILKEEPNYNWGTNENNFPPSESQ